MATSSKQTRQRTVWMWKSSINPWSNVEADEWKRYSDIENCMIEHAYHQNSNQVELDDFWIDFKHKVQINKNDPNKQRPIKRLMMSDEYIREERFMLEHPKLTPKSFSTRFGSFLIGTRLLNAEINGELVEKAAQGILEEGTKLGKQKEAEWIVNELRKVKEKNWKKIGECCVKLYTMESFLYKLVNKVMREAEIEEYEFLSERDKTYARTLGPYCILLTKYLYRSPNEEGIVVFRSANLTNEMIDDYKKHIGQEVMWNSFSSTTKSKDVALNFGNGNTNTLFQIEIPPKYPWPNTGISSLSEYPNEEEVLLVADTRVTIQIVEYDPKIKKHVIYLDLDVNTDSVS